MAHEEKWVFKRPWSPPSKEPVVVASATCKKIVYRVKLGGNVDAHQVIVSVEVGPEDKDAGIEAIWPAGICTNIVI